MVLCVVCSAGIVCVVCSGGVVCVVYSGVGGVLCVSTEEVIP